ncbi:ABC transporter substrate-binding protein [Rhodoligotrophos defluvii]|uniref:ABC transporter substrate-binding protein n=1 Tax=Rhodoligotrophos defluvii TaxID=2561934 RepID=UPI0010C9B73B|nr:ABC transporter substrate-binding protein [Rhodoligotrophos defluvii]
MKAKAIKAAVVAALFTVGITGPGLAQATGVTEDKVVIGAFLPLQSGLAAGAVQVRDGTNAYLRHVNENGGVNGRKIEWLVENDSYNPQQSVAAARSLVERDGIFAFVSTLGTVTNLAVLPYIKQRQVPLIGPIVGSPTLLEPEAKEVFGILPTGVERGRALARYILDDLKAEKIAILYQNDDFGKDPYDGLVEVLKEAGKEIVAEASYEPNDIDMSSQVARLRSAEPDVVVLAGIPKPVALFLKTAEAQGWAPTWVGPSLLADPLFAELGGSAVEGMHIVFDVALPNMPEAQATNEILAKYAPNTRPGYFAYNGVIGAMLFVEALKRIEGEPTRETLIEAMESIKDFKSGIFPPITYSEEDHAGVDKFGVAIWKGGKLEIIKSW